MRQRLRNSELLDVFEGDVVRLVADEGLAAAEKLGIFTYDRGNDTRNGWSFIESEGTQGKINR